MSAIALTSGGNFSYGNPCLQSNSISSSWKYSFSQSGAKVFLIKEDRHPNPSDLALDHQAGPPNQGIKIFGVLYRIVPSIATGPLEVFILEGRRWIGMQDQKVAMLLVVFGIGVMAWFTVQESYSHSVELEGVRDSLDHIREDVREIKETTRLLHDLSTNVGLFCDKTGAACT
ncbi:MAG: hypothetical protein MPK75_00030 [Alphaproteobacteria bacterium]|nr:hypothetical protein [Alphaproteobacteria bacterium]